ncbi:MFS transporter [Blastococcus sp. TML/M2B]|uniref:MFS transporter n=1 Tax=Blastococcus sp. TML/M2B TaxID=2798727 RepID=UPI0035CCD2FA
MTSPDPLTDHQPLPTAEGPGRLAGWRALRPLRHRDYRLLFGFLATSLCAIGMWTIVMVFQVLAIDDRPQALSAVGACLSAGLLAFAVVGGVAADRYPRRMVLVAVQLLNTLTLSAVAALSLSGAVGLWHLALASALLGAGSAFTFPAYSAYLPQVLPGEELLAANGLEGALRPTMQQGLGPALGGAVVGATMPGVGALVAAVLSAVALSCTLLLSTRHDLPPTAGDATPRPRLLTELRDGVTFVVRTRWLLWTLLFASVMTLAIMGPLEVLLPFRVREEFSNGEQAFGLLLAAYGVGGAAGSLVMSSLRLPRRYLTTMVLLWGAGTLPLALVGLTSAFWLLLACLFVIGASTGAGMVIWGTLLQRRVPPHMIGRVASLDFFVSIALMPLSIALAGPLATVVPIPVIFLFAAAVPAFAAVVAVTAGRLARDESEHPLDSVPLETDAVAVEAPPSDH